MISDENGKADRGVSGRWYAQFALGAAVAGLIAIVAFGLATQPAASTTTPLSIRVSRWAVLGIIVGFPLGATVLAASRHRYARAARWVATLLLAGLMLFFLAPGLVFMPAVALMLLAAVLPGSDDQRSAEPTRGQRRGVSRALVGGLVTLLVIVVVGAAMGWWAGDGQLKFSCTVPANETIAQTVGIRPDNVSEFSGGGEFNASATHDGRTVVLVTCDPSPPGSLEEVTSEGGAAPDQRTASGVPFAMSRTAGDDLPLTVRFVHRDALITISVADTLDAGQAGRLIDSWITEVTARTERSGRGNA